MSDTTHMPDVESQFESIRTVHVSEIGEGIDLNHDPNDKSCYTPIQEKLQPFLIPIQERLAPVLERIEPVVTPTVRKVTEFFDDDPEESKDGENMDPTIFNVTPVRLGAAVVGLLVGTLVMDPFVGLACAGAAGYAT